MTPSKNLALFDLDHTLLPLDSDYQWADFLARTGRIGDPAAAMRRNDELMDRYNAGQLSAEESAAFMLGLLAQRPLQELHQWHEAFMAEIIEPALLPQARNLINSHQSQGDLCAIVTATNEFVTAPIAKLLGIEHLIAVIPETDAQGLYTGRIQGVASFQEGKITRVDQWLQQMGLDRNHFEKIWFYSDSPNDLALLEVVSHPVATNPSPALRQIAQERNWPILDLFEDFADAKS